MTDIVHGSARYGRGRGELPPLIYVRRSAALVALEPGDPDYARALDGAFGAVSEYKPTNIVAGSARYYDAEEPPRVFVLRATAQGEMGDILETRDPDYGPVIEGEFGAIAAYEAPSTANGGLAADDLLRLAKASFDARVAAGVVEVDVGAPGEPVIVGASIDPAKVGVLYGAMALAQADELSEFSWTATVDGQPADVTLVGPQVIAIGMAVSAKYQAMRVAYNAIRAAIAAGGIATAAQIESPPAPIVWPV